MIMIKEGKCMNKINEWGGWCLSSYQSFGLDVLSKVFILSNISEYEYNQKSFMKSNKGRKMHTFPFDK
jgi:hypothetical protein